MIDNSRSSAADVVCLDLEDNVPPDQKQAARSIVETAVRNGGFSALELIVRINVTDRDEQARDLAMLAAAGAHDILVPKVCHIDDLAIVRRGLGSAPVRLWAMIESARGLENCAALAKVDDVTALVVGAGDLAADLRLPKADEAFGLQLHGARIVAAARAAGRCAIEGITEMSDAPNPCGFDGRSTYPGADIAKVNATFSPTSADVARARAALEQPYAYGDHLDAARRTLLRAESTAARDMVVRNLPPLSGA
jgi:citrate lyase beta subunit